MPQSDSRLLYVQTGATYGETPATPVGADALTVFDVSMKPLDPAMVPRQQIDTQGNSRIVKDAVTATFGTLEFSTYLLASGTAGTAPLVDTLFNGCGITSATVTGTSVTYSQATLNSETGFNHYHLYHGGDFYRLYNARGSAELTFAAGNLPVIKWTYEGMYVPPAAGAIIAPSYGTSALDVVIDATNTGTFTLGPTGSPIPIEFTTFTLNLGNEISRFDNGGGNKRVTISSRTPTASATIRHTTHSTFNPFALAASETEHALKLVHSAAGKRITIDLPRFTYNAPGTEDQNNEIFWGLELMLSRSANSLNPFTIKFD